jgi:apolipoprotein N-acyltransferase
VTSPSGDGINDNGEPRAVRIDPPFQAEQAYVPDTTIRIVQPALDQLQKSDSGNRDEIISRYVQLSAPERQPLTPGTVLVWPETAFPFALTEEPAALAAIADLLPPGVTLVTGAYRVERSREGRPACSTRSIRSVMTERSLTPTTRPTLSRLGNISRAEIC